MSTNAQALPATVDHTPAISPSDLERIRGYVERAKAPATWKAYKGAWSHFTGWCEQHGHTPLPASPLVVILYLEALGLEGRKVSTMNRQVAAIAQVHRAHNLPSPTDAAEFRVPWAGIRRTFGAPAKKALPATTDKIRAMIATLNTDEPLGCRDAALILVGFAGAFRRSELVALDVADVTRVDDGLKALIRRSKTDQESQGRTVGIPYGSHRRTCPVRSYQAWLEMAWIRSGPVFRPVDRHGHISDTRLSDRAVDLIIRRAAERAGLGDGYSGHSLRAGLATAAAAAGVPTPEIKRQTGHKSLEVLHGCIREGSLFRNNAAAQVGL
jgi:integrase